VTTLHARSISFGYARRSICRDLSLAVQPGLITAIVGRNGCGKSTLLKAMLGLIRTTAGVVELDGRPLRRWSRREVARRIAYLPQSPVAPQGLTVRELVSLGRYPHRRLTGNNPRQDREVVANSLAHCEIQHLAERAVSTLSGGERQRAWIATVLAQDSPLVLLDEPITALDIQHQLQVMTLLRALNQQHGLTVCMVLHDINLALRYCDHLVAMRDGEIRYDQRVDELPWAALMEDVFGVHATPLAGAANARPTLDFTLFPDSSPLTNDNR